MTKGNSRGNKNPTIEEKIVSKISYEIKKIGDDFFSYVWRDKISNILKEESKYNKLVDWLDNEIKSKSKTVNVFCPADRDENYTNEYFKIYSEHITSIAMMIHFRELLLDERSTEQMRENIEYTICKIYGTHYNEKLHMYI